jgi:hypothetical protein
MSPALSRSWREGVRAKAPLVSFHRVTPVHANYRQSEATSNQKPHPTPPPLPLLMHLPSRRTLMHLPSPSADVSVAYATLVAPSSMTHSTNPNQRVVKLQVRAEL